MLGCEDQPVRKGFRPEVPMADRHDGRNVTCSSSAAIKRPPRADRTRALLSAADGFRENAGVPVEREAVPAPTLGGLKRAVGCSHDRGKIRRPVDGTVHHTDAHRHDPRGRLCGRDA